jgi:type IV secretion system protein VirB10
MSNEAEAVVIDRAPDPRNKWAGKLTTVATAGAAAMVLLYALVFGEWGRAADSRVVQAARLQPPKPNVETLEQLRRRLEREPEPVAVSASVPVRPQVDDEPDIAMGAPKVDPVADERKRKDYESLFASNLAWSKSGKVERPNSRAIDRDEPPTSEMPSTDEVVQSVVRAMTASQTPQAPPVASTTSTASTETKAVPAATGAPLHRVFEGTVLDAVLANRLDGSAIAPVNCLTTNPIYAHDGTMVIPEGSRVLGSSRAVQNFGESRLAVSFHRLILPDGRSITLDKFVALNQRGDAGLKDQVNNHYAQIFGAAAAVGLISGLSQTVGRGFTDGDNNTVVIAGGITDSTSQAMAQTMNRFLNRLPTVTIREGHRVKVYLTSDLELPRYGTN